MKNTRRFVVRKSTLDQGSYLIDYLFERFPTISKHILMRRIKTLDNREFLSIFIEHYTDWPVKKTSVMVSLIKRDPTMAELNKYHELMEEFVDALETDEKIHGLEKYLKL